MSGIILTLALVGQIDPVLQDWTTTLAAARQAGEREAVIGRLAGTDNRVSLCALNDSVTVLRCFRSTQRVVNGVRTVVYSDPVDYDGQPLADVLEAERTWAGITP